MSEENVKIIEGVYQSFAQGDIPSVLGAMAEDIIWKEAENFPYADGNPYQGPAAVLEGVFKRLGSEWEHFTARADRILDAGQTVVVEGRYQAKHRATSREINAQMVHVWDLKGGKITRFQQYADTLQVARAITPTR